MNIKKILKELVTYYECTRQVGHTTAVIEGLRNKPKAIFVTHSLDNGDYFKLDDLHIIKIDYIGSSLRGHNRPIVFDNAALHVIFNEALEKIESLEAKTSNQEKDVFDDIEEENTIDLFMACFKYEVEDGEYYSHYTDEE